VIKGISGILFLLLSIFANAGTLTCAGTVEELAYHGNGRFMVKLSTMNKPVFFCNAEAVWTVSGTGYQTGQETCKMMYSTFLAAKSTKSVLDYIHFDGDDVPENCNNFASWANVSIRYFKVK
tara:strand:+ start:4265 stop:4630 length:366 start_codon:yes stop_codon:yes gene_type:complete